MRKHRSNICKFRPCLATESTNSARMRTIVTAALQRQYSQTELIFWLTLVVADLQLLSQLIDWLFIYSHWNVSTYMFNPLMPNDPYRVVPHR